MAGNVNVNPDVTDQFYRYKMPRLIAKVEGKGNGIKTVIPNMVEVAKSLDRPATYPTKYFGCELGAQTQFDFKNERYIVNGAHDSAKLQDLLGNFIRKFVLCPECDNPETHLAVQQKKGMILQRCIACGHQCNIDMRHKLTTFILKNPPDQDPAAAGTTPAKKDKKSKGKRGSSKKDSVNGDTSPKTSTSGGNDKAGHPTSVSTSYDDEDDVDWGEDVSEEAIKQRQDELSDAALKLAVSDDLERTEQERIDLFYQFVKERKETFQITGTEKEKEVVSKAETLEIKDKAPLILVELLYEENILPAIKQYRNLFLRFTHKNAKAQKYMLGGMEQLIGKVYSETLLPKAAGIFKGLYDLDILEEEVLIDWAKKGPSRKYVSKEVSKEIHQKVSPLIKWLEEAEEESEDSDEEDDVEVVYSHTEKVGTGTIPTDNKQSNADKKDEEEDDFDIDAI